MNSQTSCCFVGRSDLRVCVVLCFQGSQKELLNLSQQDYANRIEELNQSLKEAWASDQKVKALKIVIQVKQRRRRPSSPFGSEPQPSVSAPRSSAPSCCPTPP